MQLVFDTSARDPTYKESAKVVELLSLLDPSMEDHVILDACHQLVCYRQNIANCDDANFVA
jgi:hypothetical protein